MVAMKSYTASGSCTAQVLATLAQTLAEAQPFTADFLCVFYDALHDDQAITLFLDQHFPGVARLGGTSCAGVMSDAGLAGGGSIGLLLVQDPDGDYGTAAIRLQGNAADCAERALQAALHDAGCPGELPELVWIYQAPGQEEAVIEGLRRIVSDRCPIIGGSSADDDIGGRWRQLGPDGPLCDGLGGRSAKPAVVDLGGRLFVDGDDVACCSPPGASATSSRVAMNPAVTAAPSPASAPPPPRAGRHATSSPSTNSLPPRSTTAGLAEHSSRSSLRAATSSGPRPCFRSASMRAGLARCAAIG